MTLPSDDTPLLNKGLREFRDSDAVHPLEPVEIIAEAPVHTPASPVSKPSVVPPLDNGVAGDWAIALVLAQAQRHIGVAEQGGPNRGPMVNKYLKACGLGPGYPWCMAFCQYVGKKTLTQYWPLPMSAACQTVAEWAERKGILRNTPKVGDLYLLYYDKPGFNRFAHVGIVTAVHPDGSISTLEGNTNDDGSREGWKVCPKKRRPKSHDAFVRWASLVPARRPEGFVGGGGLP